MENDNSTNEIPLLSEEIERDDHVLQAPEVKNYLKDDNNKEFESLLNLHRPNRTLSLIETYFFGLLPLVLFIATNYLYFRSTLNVPQVSYYNTHGGLLGQSFVGVLLVYIPGFYEWYSSMRDGSIRSAPVLIFKILGWILLIITFAVALSYSKI